MSYFSCLAMEIK